MIPIIDVTFHNIPQEIRWLHHQAAKGLADKIVKNEVAFVIGPGDKSVWEGMEDWNAVILVYKVKPEIH